MGMVLSSAWRMAPDPMVDASIHDRCVLLHLQAAEEQTPKLSITNETTQKTMRIKLPCLASRLYERAHQSWGPGSVLIAEDDTLIEVALLVSVCERIDPKILHEP